jgi:hypothetical protein
VATDIEYAALCSAATFREGLLSILEAGLERFQPNSLPAVIQPVLVAKVSLDGSDVGQTHLVRAVVELLDSGEASERIADIGFSVQPRPADPDALSLYAVLIHPLVLEVRKPGVYEVRITLNGEQAKRIPFQVFHNFPQV